MATFTLESAEAKAVELMDAKTIVVAHVARIGDSIGVRALRWEEHGGDWSSIVDTAADITTAARE